GGPTAWQWDFGDSSISTSQNPAHTYAAAGDYVVTLIAANSNGSCPDVIRIVNVSTPDVPVASFTWAQAASPPLTIQFADASTGGPTAWQWDFGDSSISTSQNPAHTYAAAGDYVVTLTASNSGGASNPATRTVRIVLAPIQLPPPLGSLGSSRSSYPGSYARRSRQALHRQGAAPQPVHP